MWENYVLIIYLVWQISHHFYVDVETIDEAHSCTLKLVLWRVVTVWICCWHRHLNKIDCKKRWWFKYLSLTNVSSYECLRWQWPRAPHMHCPVLSASPAVTSAMPSYAPGLRGAVRRAAGDTGRGRQCTMGLDGGFFEVCCVNTYR